MLAYELSRTYVAQARLKPYIRKGYSNINPGDHMKLKIGGDIPSTILFPVKVMWTISPFRVHVAPKEQMIVMPAPASRSPGAASHYSSAEIRLGCEPGSVGNTVRLRS